MQNSLFRKGLVLGIILCFIGLNIIPSAGFNLVVNKPLIKSFEDITFYVGGSGPNNYTKIQDAIDNASDGDTVFVYDDSSPYYENIEIDKSIYLIGEDKNTTVIDGSESEVIVYISADDVIISEFTIYNGRPGGMLYDFFGILLYECSNYEVSNNNFIKIDTGIGSYLGDFGSIIGNYFDGKIYFDSVGIKICTSDTIICNNYFTKHSGECIIVTGNPKLAENISIIKNVFTNSSEGIFGGSKNSIIQSNYFYNNQAGIQWGGYYTKILNNTVINTKFIITDPMHVSIFHGINTHNDYNNISKNYVYNYFQGIYLNSADYNIISNNQINKCKCGIQIYDSRYNQIFRNNITKSNGYPLNMYYPDYSGLILTENAYNNHIYQNNFIQNLFQATFIGEPDNSWNENYWNKPMDNPKVIIGRKETLIYGFPIYIFPEFNYDLNPAQEPYDIQGDGDIIKSCGLE